MTYLGVGPRETATFGAGTALKAAGDESPNAALGTALRRSRKHTTLSHHQSYTSSFASVLMPMPSLSGLPCCLPLACSVTHTHTHTSIGGSEALSVYTIRVNERGTSTSTPRHHLDLGRGRAPELACRCVTPSLRSPGPASRFAAISCALPSTFCSHP